MGNISYVVPVENKQDIDKNKVTKLLTDAFPDLDVELHEVGQIIVTKDGETVCELWIEDDGCYLLQEDDEENEDYEKVKALNLDPNELCLGISYGHLYLYETYRSEVVTFLTDHFKGYWFDEGIHPEFISHTDEFLNKYR